MKQKRFPRWLRKLLRRRFLITFLIIAQAASFVYLITSGSMLSQRLSRGLTIIIILVVPINLCCASINNRLLLRA